MTHDAATCTDRPPRHARRAGVVALTAALLAACASPGSVNPSPGAVRASPTGAQAPEAGATGEPATSAPRDRRVGVIVIDVQRSFVSTAERRNPGSNVAARVAASQRVLELVATRQTPLFVTYEAAKTGSGALAASLASVLPSHAREFIKTTFAATSQPQLAEALRASGLRRFLVVGAETDVCVLQTILGLRRAGHAVFALRDAMFTEEVNVTPALRRMELAGAALVGMSEAEALVSESEAAPEEGIGEPALVRPLEIGIVLHDVQGLGASDPFAAPKRTRLRELLLISEWFRIPLLAADPASTLAALPSDLRSIVTRGVQALASRPAAIKQLAVAGGHGRIGEAVAALRADGTDVFIVEDVLLGGSRTELDPLYAQASDRAGAAAPITYKTLYYELIRSVNDAEWPSPQWVTASSTYYDLTKGPEELPPLGP